MTNRHFGALLFRNTYSGIPETRHDVRADRMAAGIHVQVPELKKERESTIARLSAYFSNVFGQSPFIGVQQHAALCIEAAAELPALLVATNEGEWDVVAGCYEHIAELENAADQKKRGIRSSLPHGFFLPVARTDLLKLLGRQDQIANGARDVAGIVTGRRMQFPPEMQTQVIEFTEHSVSACRRAKDVVCELDELIDSGFRGPEARRVVRMIESVEDDEHKVDELMVQIRARLYALEDQLPPVQVMFLYRVLEQIADLSDVAERVAHSVQMMLAK